MPTHEAFLRIGPDHPALPGHFPGRPLVPGVVLLDSVLSEAEAWLGRPLVVRCLQQAKFTAPLLPGQEARMQLKLVDEALRFTLTRHDATIAQGAFRLAAEPPK